MSRFSWGRLLHMVRKELKQLVRDPKARPIIFVAPVVQMILLGYAATTDVKRIRALVVDHDRTVESRARVSAPRGAARTPAGVELRARAWFNAGLESRHFNVPAIMGVLLMMVRLLLTSLAVVREREIGTLAALLLAAGLYVLARLALGLLISTVSRTQQEAFMLLVLFFLPAVVLSGFLSPVESMPAGFRWLSALDPLRWFLEIVRGVRTGGTLSWLFWRAV